MQFKVRLVVAPGNENVERAGISKISAIGTEEPDQMILEGETIECTVMVLAGEKIVIKQLEPPLYYDVDEKMALNMTPAMIKEELQNQEKARQKAEADKHKTKAQREQEAREAANQKSAPGQPFASAPQGAPPPTVGNHTAHKVDVSKSGPDTSQHEKPQLKK